MNVAPFAPPTTSTSSRATPLYPLNWENETLTAYALNVIHHEQGRTFVATMHVVPELIKSHWTNPINYPRGTRELLLVDNLLTLGAWRSGRGMQRGGFKSNKQINCIRIHSESVVRDQNVTGRIQIQCTRMWVGGKYVDFHALQFLIQFFLVGAENSNFRPLTWGTWALIYFVRFLYSSTCYGFKNSLAFGRKRRLDRHTGHAIYPTGGGLDKRIAFIGLVGNLLKWWSSRGIIPI